MIEQNCTAIRAIAKSLADAALDATNHAHTATLLDHARRLMHQVRQMERQFDIAPPSLAAMAERG